MNREQFDNIFKTYKPNQHSEELWWLVKKVEKIRPKTILEIGVKTGATLFLWDSVLSDSKSSDCLLIGIDLNNNFSWDTKKSKNNIKMLFTDSRKKETIDIVKYILKDRKIDFAFIDGGHTEPVVTSDFQNYSKFVRKAGIVAFHDIYNKNYPGVGQFWDKVRWKKETINYGIGIGIIEI